MFLEICEFESPASRAGEAPFDKVYVYAEMDMGESGGDGYLTSPVSFYFTQEKLAFDAASPIEGEFICEFDPREYTLNNRHGHPFVDYDSMSMDIEDFLIDELPEVYADFYTRDGLDASIADDEYCLLSEETYSKRSEYVRGMRHRRNYVGIHPSLNDGHEEIIWQLFVRATHSGY